jgi:DNA-binding MarR family transcriptional regulator
MAETLSNRDRALLADVARRGHVLRSRGSAKESGRRERLEMRGLLEYVPGRCELVRLTDAGRAALSTEEVQDG